MECDAFTPKVTPMKFRQMVVADAADVVGAQPPSLAGDNGGGDLAAEHDLRVESFDLGAEGGELGDLENGIGGVFADCRECRIFVSA